MKQEFKFILWCNVLFYFIFDLLGKYYLKIKSFRNCSKSHMIVYTFLYIRAPCHFWFCRIFIYLYNNLYKNSVITFWPLEWGLTFLNKNNSLDISFFDSKTGTNKHFDEIEKAWWKASEIFSQNFKTFSSKCQCLPIEMKPFQIDYAIPIWYH